MFCQSEDTGEKPGGLTQRDEEWQAKEETITVTVGKEEEGGAVQEDTNTQPTECQRQ